MRIRMRTSYRALESYKHLTNDYDIILSQANLDREKAKENSTQEKSEFFIR